MQTAHMTDAEIAEALSTRSASRREIADLLGVTDGEVKKRAKAGGYVPLRKHASPEVIAQFRDDVAFLNGTGMTYASIGTEAGFSPSAVASAMAATKDGTAGLSRRLAKGVRVLSLRVAMAGKRQDAAGVAAIADPVPTQAPAVVVTHGATLDVLTDIEEGLVGVLRKIDAGLANGLPKLVKDGLVPVRRHVALAIEAGFGGRS